MPETYGTSGPPQKMVPLPREGYGSLAWFQDQLQAAEEKITKYESRWKENVRQLTGTPLTITPTTDTIVIPLDHANVEQKKAQLYFRNPEVQLTAAAGYEAQADAVQAFGALLNETLGPDGVDAEAMMDEMLTDVLCPAGLGVTVLGMELAQDGVKPIQVGSRPATPEELRTLLPGAVLGVQVPDVPIMAEVPNILHQEYFWSRLSPLAVRIPNRFHGTNFDRAPWLAYRFELDKTLAMRTWGLSEEEANTAGGEPRRLNEDEQVSGRDTEVVYGYCVSYKASLFRPDVKHPQEIWRLILIKGSERILRHDRPFQRYAPDGRTLIGLMGHFIHVYTPRYISDSAFPPSDVSMSRHQVDELSKGRSQMMQQRDRARPMRQMNISLVDPQQAEKIKRGEYQEIIFTTSNEPIVQEVAHATYPRENFEFNRIAKDSISESWALGDTQRGIPEQTRRTATEIAVRRQGSNVRLNRERRRLAKWYAKGAQKLAGLLQLFEDERTTVQILGEEGLSKLVAWDLKALPVRFVCTVKPDSMQPDDAEEDFRQALQLYQLTANDPNVNRVEVLKTLFRKANHDPSKIVVAELPEKKPESPKVSLTVKGEDLNPTAPQFPIVQGILTASGMPIDPQNIALGIALATKQQMLGGAVNEAGGQLTPGSPPADTAHGGAVQEQEPLSKHAADQTGKLDGLGMAGGVN